VTRLVTAGSALAVYSDALPTSIVNALPLSLLWGQAVTRTGRFAIGTEAYFQNLSAELGRIAWNVTDAGVLQYSATANGDDPGQAILALTSDLVSAEQRADMAQLFAMMAQPQTGSLLDAALTTWWSRRDVAAQGTVFAAVTAGINNNLQLEATLLQLEFAVSAGSWRSFFVSRLCSGAQLIARHARITLNADLWGRFEDPLTRKLGQAATASIQAIDL